MTIKEYYNDEFLTTCNGKVIGKTEEGIILDRTVAFPEGGGQDGDTGKLVNLKTGEELDLIYTTKEGGRRVVSSDFSGIHVDTDVIHHLLSEDLGKINIGDEFKVKINVKRRALLTMYHSGIHIVLMAVNKLRPNIKDLIYGCKITETYARLDFKVLERFSKEELEKITEITEQLIADEKEIKTYPSKEEKEALYWECEDYKIPCGGTHFKNTKYLGKPIIKRKNLGKASERIKLEFESCDLPMELYHE